MVLPLCKWLLEQSVKLRYDVEVTKVDFDAKVGCKQAAAIHWLEDRVVDGTGVGADDLVFMTIGSLTQNSDKGDHHTPARLGQEPRPLGICGDGA
ncbi:myosin-crossreactive antigen [Bradyrhizobium sp. USDA 4473]